MLQRETLLLSVLCTLLFATALQGQRQVKNLSLTAPTCRIPLDVPSGRTTLRICGFEPGKTYQVIANGAFYGQEASLELRSALSGGEVQPLSGRPEALRLRASSECLTFDPGRKCPWSDYRRSF